MRREGKDVRVLAFRMPVKGSAITLDQIRPHLEQHLDCSIQSWADGGLVWMRLGTRRMPRLVSFDELAATTEGVDLPVATGVSREGEQPPDCYSVIGVDDLVEVNEEAYLSLLAHPTRSGPASPRLCCARPRRPTVPAGIG